MKKIVLSIILVLVAALVNAEEVVQFDKNNSATVYLIKQSLVQETTTVRTLWVKYQYTKMGSTNLKNDIKTNRVPLYSKVKYGFDCSNKQHKVFLATIYDSYGAVITNIKDGAIEEVIPGSVGEAIRNFTCSYDMNENVPGTAI